MEEKKPQIYGDITIKELKEIVKNLFKDYKDPTENMTISQKEAFDKAFKKHIEDKYGK